MLDWTVQETAVLFYQVRYPNIYYAGMQLHCLLFNVHIGHCINYIYVMAYTSNIANAGADLRHSIRLQAKGLISTQTLPDLPQDDYFPKKGDLWKLSLKSYFGFTTCVTLNDIQRILILAGNSDEWNIESIVTFAVVNQYYWELTSSDLNVFQWIDADVEGYKEFTLSFRTSTGQCIHFLYIMAYTSSQLGGGADLRHSIELKAKGITKTQILSDLPGNDYYSSKGDLWKLSIEDYFGFTGCITKKDIQGIALLAGNNDGWHIDSIVTYVTVNEFNWELSSVDLEAHRWVDGDSLHTYKRFALTLVI